MYRVRCRKCGLILLDNGKVLHGIIHSTHIPEKKMRKQEMAQIKKGITADNWGYCDPCFTKETGRVFMIKNIVLSEDPEVRKTVKKLPGLEISPETKED